MSTNVRPIPEGYRTLSPALTCKNAARAIEFYKAVFGATVNARMDGPGGMIMHAELQIGDSRIFLGDECPGMAEAPDPQIPAIKTGSAIFMYTEDVDSVVKRATEAGSRLDMPVEDMFWGDRYGKFTDPFGHNWAVATHVEEVAPEEMKRRMDAMSNQMAKAAGNS
jgi:PhnB protein